jgi:hypothetical protein
MIYVFSFSVYTFFIHRIPSTLSGVSLRLFVPSFLLAVFFFVWSCFVHVWHLRLLEKEKLRLREADCSNLINHQSAFGKTFPLILADQLIFSSGKALLATHLRYCYPTAQLISGPLLVPLGFSFT